jgi:hypothetical protein
MSRCVGIMISHRVAVLQAVGSEEKNSWSQRQGPTSAAQRRKTTHVPLDADTRLGLHRHTTPHFDFSCRRSRAVDEHGRKTALKTCRQKFSSRSPGDPERQATWPCKRYRPNSKFGSQQRIANPVAALVTSGVSAGQECANFAAAEVASNHGDERDGRDERLPLRVY